MANVNETKSVIRVGSRASRLAVIQSEIIMRQIEEVCPGVKTELITMKTTGDRILDRTLDQIGGKGLFVKELDEALRRAIALKPEGHHMDIADGHTSESCRPMNEIGG